MMTSLVFLSFGLFVLIVTVYFWVRVGIRSRTGGMRPSYRRWVEPLMVIAAIVITGIPAAIFYLHGESPNSATTGTPLPEGKFAQIALNVPGTVKATLYFGQLNAITAYLKG